MSFRHIRPPSRPLPTALVLLAALVLGAACAPQAAERAAPDFPEEWGFGADTRPVTAERGMVSTTDSYATDVGVQVLRAGGNAVDAAVAVGFALAVVDPDAGNIGGGGFMVTHMADGTTAALDYREKAPLAATPDMYLDEDGNLTDRSVVGHLAAGVPGTVRGMWDAHQRFGTLQWEELVEPAIRLADGFVVTERQHEEIFAEEEEGLRRFEATAATYLPGGEVPQAGDTLRLPELAATLRRIRDHGPDGFYVGETADLIVAEMERGGGIITHEDLERYDTEWRDPIRFTYRGHPVISMPPSSSGGATMAEIGNILEGYDFAAMEWHSTRQVHLLVEAYKRAFVDRNTYLADTDFVAVPLDSMISPGYASRRREGIRLASATPSAEVEPGLGPEPEPASARESRQTTHFSVVDGAGNAVAVTTTLNSGYGSKVLVEGAGFVLNNEMDDFSAKPGAPNQYGLVEGKANAIVPGKRMLSSMSPTVVLDPEGEVLMVTGTPGGSTIITTTFQTISNVVDYGMNAAQAVLAPRIHHQHLPDQVSVERNGLPGAVVDSLEALGHTVTVREGFSGNAQVIRVRPDGTLEGVADPRRGGTAAGY